jgi:hypothetical protein
MTRKGRDYFGDLAAPTPIRTRTWREYLTAKADASLAAGAVSTVADTAAMAEDLPELAAMAFAHLDAFPGEHDDRRSPRYSRTRLWLRLHSR